MKKSRYIFVVGGVISGLGKGVACGSIGAILRCLGYSVTIKKLDPYLNVDPGTLNPIEHGEVYVTYDGGETDLDLGYYERFANIQVTKNNSTSSGKLLDQLLKDERKGVYLGKTITMFPHFTNNIKDFIYQDDGKFDVIICEIGGSAGDYEANAFLESIRQIKQERGSSQVLVCALSYLVYYNATKELKTKPTQVAIRQLMMAGVDPDILLLRSEHTIDDVIKQKIAGYTNIHKEHIISAYNVQSIYQVPLEYVREGLFNSIQSKLDLPSETNPTVSLRSKIQPWIKLNRQIQGCRYKIRLALVGKYVELEDSYYSVIEAIQHAGWHYSTTVEIVFVNARDQKTTLEQLHGVHCILAPGGFGTTGMETIIAAITYARVKKIPFLGICLGMQLAVIEFARNVLNMHNASSKEFGINSDIFVVDWMYQWQNGSALQECRNKGDNLGGTLRLGQYPTVISSTDSIAYQMYKKHEIVERHRHRYEVNIAYKELLESRGMEFTGISHDGLLPEIVEVRGWNSSETGKYEFHPYFIGCQFHPEFQSSPFIPHPLFQGLIFHGLVYDYIQKIEIPQTNTIPIKLTNKANN